MVSIMATENLGTELRKEKRYPFKWRVAIVVDASEAQETYHGITYDVSLGGCSMLTDHNVWSDHPVSVLISLPVENPAGRTKLIEAKGQMVYTVLSAGHQQFRCGIQFLSFKGKGRSVLETAIEKRAVTFTPHGT
jgi:c-di-GMP-binding flagellar brake protein YcgR